MFKFLIFDSVDLRIQSASPPMLSTLGYDLEELSGMRLLDVLPDISEPTMRRLTRRMAAMQSPTSEFETRVSPASGRPLVAKVRLDQIGRKEPILFHVIIERPFGEAAGRLGRRLDAALLRSVIDTAPDAIITIKSDGNIRSFSPAAERMFGYDAEEVVGRNVNILMPDPHRSEHDRYIDRYLKTGEKRVIGVLRPLTARHRDGRTFPIEIAIGEVRSGASHIFTGFIRDTSERVAEQNRTLQQELSHVSRLSAMGEITSMIVHELNQPLTAIANFGEAAKRLLDAGGPPGRAAEFMEKSVAQAHRASEMIRRLRNFVSRGSNERELINVNEVVREAARLALIGAADQRIRTHFDLGDDLPHLMADRIQIQQVLVNLIRNGIDAMLDGGLDTSNRALLSVQTTFEERDVRISVRDTGPGISEAVATGIFNPFVTTKKGGMGIGLSVSRSIVEAHAGRIWVDPADGLGTRFVFTLPVADEDRRS